MSSKSLEPTIKLPKLDQQWVKELISECISQLREEIKSLNEQLDGKEDETISRLRGLKQQNDKVQLHLNDKIKMRGKI